MNTILIIDDDPEICAFLKDALLKAGHIVESRLEIQAGLKSLGTFTPDILLLDYSVLGGDGKEFVKTARRISPHTVIILISGSDNIEKIAQDLKLNGYIEKPFKIGALRSEIERLVASKP